MKQNQQENDPKQQMIDFGYQKPHKERGTISLGVLLSVVCLVAAVSVLLTYTLTAASQREHYGKLLTEQQQTIDALRSEDPGYSDFNVAELDVLAALFERYSYYAGKVSEKELLTAVLKAYAEATGDRYAEYYTKEEYDALTAENMGDHVGIGVNVIQTEAEINGRSYSVFQVIAVYQNGPAANSGLQVGDLIYAVKSEDVLLTIDEIGGFSKAIALVKGEEGTVAELSVFRENAEGYEVIPFAIVRDSFESISVTHRLIENDPTSAVIHISNFDLTTPHQLKTAVLELKSAGVSHFVLDVRNNPGGDLQSIKAVLTYFLQPGDMILSAIDRTGKTVTTYKAEPMLFLNEYVSCNVSAEEIGMFADLDMVVLCNENTASAAEVFTATVRDYGLAPIVGVKTFGKGIMQSFLPLSRMGDYTGYVKMTTYAYVTKCGVTYHEIGISPSEGCLVELSEEAKQYNFYLLPQGADNQLQAALAQFFK